MGKIELDHTGSGSGVTLSSDGTDLLLNGTAIGGGGGPATIDAKTGAYTVTTDDVGKVLLFTLTGAATCSLPAAATAGSGFYVEIINDSSSITQILTIDPNGAETINDASTLKLTRNSGVKLYSTGSEWRTAHGLHSAITHNFSDGNMNPTVTGDSAFAIGDTVTASGTFSMALGRSANASSSRAIAIGNSATASGSDSLAMVQNAAASGSYAVAIGKESIASGNQSTALGGFGNDATATYSTALGGSANTASGVNSATLGGGSNEATQAYSYASGLNAKSEVLGKWAHSSGLFSAKGDAQRGWQVQRTDTQGFDIQPLTTNGSSENSTNQIKVPTDTAVAFKGMIVAKEEGTSDCAAWVVEGLAVNNGGTTTLVNSATTTINNAPSWGLATQIDDGNDVVQFLAVGATSHDIRWVAAIDTVEVTAA